MVATILRDEKRILPCCIKLDGQYGLKDVYVGVPVKLGRNGIEEIIELDLTKEEMALLHESAGHVKEVMDAYDKLGLS